jgi:hypothetical protein
MPCLHCRGSMAGLLQHSALHGIGPAEDPPFIVERTMGSTGPRVRPEGFADGRICRLCGVVFFAPLQTVAASHETIAPREKLVPLLDGSHVPVEPEAGFDLTGFRAEKLVLPSDADAGVLAALREAGYQPMGDLMRVPERSPERVAAVMRRMKEKLAADAAAAPGAAAAEAGDEEDDDVDYAGCPALGVAGFHSAEWGDRNDGQCQWCGMIRKGKG